MKKLIKINNVHQSNKKNHAVTKKEFYQKSHSTKTITTTSFISEFFQQPKKYLFTKKCNNENNVSNN